MARRTILLIAGKELLDTLRDRRTLFVALILPLLLYPALLLGLTQVIGVTQRSLEAERQRVLVEGLPEGHALFDLLRERNLEPVAGELSAPLGGDEDAAWRGALRRELGDGDFVAALASEGDLAARLASRRRGEATLVYDPTDEPSRAARGKVVAALEAYAEAQREAVYAEAGEERARLEFVEEPVAVRPVELATKGQKGAYSFAPMLGMLIVLMSLTGAFYPAVDLVAGEKERGTMETLLVAPVPRTHLVYGKFAAVWIVAMVTALLNLLVMGLTFSKLAGMMGTGRIAFDLPAGTLAAVTLILIPTAALFGAAALALASFATSYKEGQQYLTPLFLVATPLSLVAILPNVEIGWGLALVPVANVVLLVKAMLLGGEGTIGPAVLAAVATTAYAGAALAAAAALFRREGVLFRTGAGRSYDPAMLRAARLHVPSPGQAALLFFVVLALMFFLAGPPPEDVAGVVRTFLAPQLLAVLLPALVFARLLKLDRRETFGLRAPAVGVWLPVALAAAATAVALAWAQRTFLPERAPEGFERTIEALAAVPPWLALLLIAIVPPVCEELLCRGFLLSGFRSRLGTARAVALSALLFGALHLSPPRFPATAAAGVLLALVVVWTGSIFPAMLFHAVYNGVLATGLFLPQTQWVLLGAGAPEAAAAAAVGASALWLARRASRR